MDELGAIVMLHIPRNGRLKDPVNLAQIMEIKQEFPNIRLIIAHIGRAYTREDVGNAFETLDKAPDLMYDFCANCCEYAITEVLRHAGPKHVMYGTDMPILRMRTHRIEENGTYINLVPPASTATRSRISTCARYPRRRRRRSPSSCMKSCWRSSGRARRWA